MICGILVQAVSSSATLLSIAALLVLKALPVLRYIMLRNVFYWFVGVFFGSIPVQADNVL